MVRRKRPIIDVASRVESRHAHTGAPDVLFQAGRLERISESPEEANAPTQRRDAPGIAGDPGQKWTASAISPELDAERRTGTRAACMKAESIGDDQGVRGDREGA